ncbi:hypothetical protein RHOFW104T7_03080 [Rhodanobacter thiooxydans]|uniref:DUF1684 domain-containing protein n=1 Tax=Rhodanobacter thiooxydans TaxID=416169 RepID=A0A154QCU2_9GAMM|nr:DUF1684 domain-containing protein [Rhodanobacter thiooxydans]EIL96651.1 hypothetical protein UUA_17450 [Rhodanobacter thiooxydans LCS2]KZC21952.1 hypothetical protein RHOFW104T7_03080 [Rhodanobacter thiooxydans]MCW0203114.1 DUF1684 domain-containing protein [Rhodanobacter thiooxydans]
MIRTSLFVAAAILGVATVQATDIDSYRYSIEQWQAGRVERLTAPDGWLSLIGLEWLKDGTNRVGSAADNDIVLSAGPARLGVVTLERDGSMRIVLDKHSGATIDGKAVAEAPLVDDAHVADDAAPTRVAFGSASFYVIDRDGRKGLRVKDTEAPSRKHFAGIDAFAIDPSWRIEATWAPVPPGETLEMGTAIGTIDRYPVPGKLEFSRDGKHFEILPVIEEAGATQYFIVFADRTSGKETYGAARFLYIDPPQDGKVVLDFNKAYNPPCAFTPFATCPLAPPENRLDLRVTAGEKKYAGAH